MHATAGGVSWKNLKIVKGIPFFGQPSHAMITVRALPTTKESSAFTLKATLTSAQSVTKKIEKTQLPMTAKAQRCSNLLISDPLLEPFFLLSFI